jgi:hypothetical protein
VKRCIYCDYPNPDDRSECYKCLKPLGAVQSGIGVHYREEPPASADPDVCALCKVVPPQPGHVTPLCSSCRRKLAGTPIPAWVTLSACLVLFVMVFAFAEFPKSLSSGIYWERGHRAEDRGDYNLAATNYERVMADYPECTNVLARTAICDCKSGRFLEAAGPLRKLEGREASKELIDELNAAVAEMEQKLPKEGR